MRLKQWVGIVTVCLGAVSGALAGVNGVVVDSAGKPVGGADVVLYYARVITGNGNRLVEKTTSAADGKFAFMQDLTWNDAGTVAGLPPRYAVIARKPETGLGYVNLQKTDSTENVKLTIESRNVVTPTVVDAAGKPVAGATVWVYAAVPQNAGNAESLGRILFVNTDLGFGGVSNDEGQAEVLVPPGMQLYLAAQKEGFARSFGDKQIVLVPGATVKGTVTGPDGRPLANTQVSVMCELIRGLGDLATTTDAQGRYEIKDIPTQGYRVEMAGQKMEGAVRDCVSAQDATGILSASSEPFNPKGGEVVIKDLKLSKGLEVSGKVVDAETGEGLPNIMLMAYSYGRTGGGSSPNMITTDAQGAFRTTAQPGNHIQINCQDSPDGSYLIDQNSRGEQGAYFSAQNLKEDKTDVTLKIHLRKLSPLSGKVVDDQGKPVAGTSIYLDNRMPATKTNPDGTFTMKKAPVDRDGVILAMGESVGGKADLKAGQSDVTIQVQPRQERECIVTNGEGGPAANLSFTYAPAAGAAQGSSFYTLNAPAQTDAQGKCTLKLISGVTYGFSWSGENDKNRDYSDANITVQVSQNATEPVTFVAKQYLNALFLKFQNTKGEPVPDVRLQVSNWDVISSDQRNTMYNLKSGKDGSVQLNRLATGLFQFQAYAQGQGNYRQSHFAIPTDEVEATCTLRRQDEPAEFLVRVVGTDGQAVANAKLTLVTQDQGKPKQQELTSDEKGLVKLPPIGQGGNPALLCDLGDKGWGCLQLQPYEDGAAVLPLHQAGPEPLTLQFVDAQKKPVVGATVKLSSLGTALPSGQGYTNQQMPYNLPDEIGKPFGLTQVTDQEGRVRFPRVDARLMGSVSIVSTEFGTQGKELPASGGSAIIEMVKQAKLHGKIAVKDPPQGLGEGGLNLILHAENGCGTYTMVQGDGSYQFEQVQPGSYSIVLSVNNNPKLQKYKLAKRPKFKLAPGEDKTLDLQLEPGIAVRGKFAGMVNGRPAKIALREDERGSFNPVEPGKDGSFEFWVGEPGDYELLYERQESSYVTLPDRITVKDRNPVEGLELKAP